MLVRGFWAFSAPVVYAYSVSARTTDEGRKTYTKLYRNGEELETSLLCNLVTTWNTLEVDESWGNNALLAGKSLENSFGESILSSVKNIIQNSQHTGNQHMPWKG